MGAEVAMHDDNNPAIEILSPSNPRVKRLAALRRRRERRNHQVTLVEGYEELDLALRANVRPHELYICPELSTGDPLAIADRAARCGAQVIQLSRPAFEKAAYRQSPDGWLAVVPDIESDLDRLNLNDAPLIIACGSVEKPGNLGSILRSCDAAGADAVVCVDPVTDWGNPNVIRASKGTVFSIPVVSTTTPEFVAWSRENRITTVATTPDTDAILTDTDLTGSVAILVGSEKYGLSKELLDAADLTAKLPMFGHVNSLNVAVTAAIAAFESVRQRATHG